MLYAERSPWTSPACTSVASASRSWSKYDATPYAESLDARAYAWSLTPPTSEATLAQALHDHAIDEALQTWLPGRRVVGVMGPHDTARSAAGDYADAARLGRLLGEAGMVVATGGGPGSMEAANLGARCAGRPEALDEALAVLDQGSAYDDVDGWVAQARAALEVAGDADSLGIPTWFYGHEPSNLFATAIAKYFRNATREAVLLEVCDAGIVYLPRGRAGTVQEVFQDACENYYAPEGSVAPMVLVGRDYWTDVLPVWPLLRSLASGRLMEPHVHLVDTVDDAAALLAS
jgi:predicted Rossmann-fold nucleotide-binding protein